MTRLSLYITFRHHFWGDKNNQCLAPTLLGERPEWGRAASDEPCSSGVAWNLRLPRLEYKLLETCNAICYETLQGASVRQHSAAVPLTLSRYTVEHYGLRLFWWGKGEAVASVVLWAIREACGSVVHGVKEHNRNSGHCIQCAIKHYEDIRNYITGIIARPEQRLSMYVYEETW
jgi:hypothetical protein